MAMVARRIVPSRSVVCADVNDEAVLLNIETGIYFGLDSLGSRIWKCIDEGADEEEIIARLLSEYEVTPEQLRTDLAEFLAQLEAHGLIETSGTDDSLSEKSQPQPATDTAIWRLGEAAVTRN